MSDNIYEDTKKGMPMHGEGMDIKEYEKRWVYKQLMNIMKVMDKYSLLYLSLDTREDACKMFFANNNGKDLGKVFVELREEYPYSDYINFAIVKKLGQEGLMLSLQTDASPYVRDFLRDREEDSENGRKPDIRGILFGKGSHS